jgi:hypothetical protein
MTARPTADDIISASATRTRGALSKSVAVSNFCAARTGVTTAVSVNATKGPAGLGPSPAPPCARRATPAPAPCRMREPPQPPRRHQDERRAVHQLSARRAAGFIPAFPWRRPSAYGRALCRGHLVATPNRRSALQGRLVAFDCELMEACEVGTRSVLIARVPATAQARAPAESLIYHRQQHAATRAL